MGFLKLGATSLANSVDFFPAGTAALPSVPIGEADSGFYSIGANNIGLTLNGVKSWDYATTATSFTGANSTSNTTLTIENTTNTAVAAHAILDIKVGGTTSLGDPQLRLSIPSGTSWYVGVDNSSSDRLFIGTGTTVGTTPMVRLDGGAAAQSGSTGQITFFTLDKTVGTGGTDTFQGITFGGSTATITNTTQRVAIFVYANFAPSFQISQSGGAVTVDNATMMHVVPPTTGASVTVTNASGIRINSTSQSGTVTNGAGLRIVGQTGATNNYQILLENAGTEPTSAPADTAGFYCVDDSAGNATIGIASEHAVAVEAITASTHVWRCHINGTMYKVLLSNV